jgi:hypothetical protein
MGSTSVTGGLKELDVVQRASAAAEAYCLAAGSPTSSAGSGGGGSGGSGDGSGGGGGGSSGGSTERPTGRAVSHPHHRNLNHDNSNLRRAAEAVAATAAAAAATPATADFGGAAAATASDDDDSSDEEDIELLTVEELTQKLRDHRRSLKEAAAERDDLGEQLDGARGRGLHSPTSQLNLSRFGQRAVLCPVFDEL